MEDIIPFGLIIAGVSLATVLAVLSNRVSERIRVPAPAIFLIVAAVVAEIYPKLGNLPLYVDQRIVTVALIIILFEGGMHIGLTRFRPAAGAVLWIGVAGTAVTTGGLALLAHLVFGFGWHTALLIGTALAPTDPAVVFSVLGRREISGRAGTILEGESGANDPVGIALMVSLLSVSGGGAQAVWSVVGAFTLEMAVGAAVGIAAGIGLRWVMQHIALPDSALYPALTIANAGLIYGVATGLHGSGFLAVFLAGIIVGDTRAPYKREIEHVTSGLASLAEIAAFILLGLIVSLDTVFGSGAVWMGLAIAALLILLIRPLLVGVLMLPIRLNWGERAFVLFSGLKGAVPILLATFVLTSSSDDAQKIFDIVFVVVLVSVIAQGGLVPSMARWFRVPVRVVEPEPWSLGLRFTDEPSGMHRYYVAEGSPADGSTIGNLALEEDSWVSLVNRRGQLLQVRGSTELAAGDEVLVLSERGTELDTVFHTPG